MNDTEFKLARRLYESLDYDIKLRFFNFAQSHHKPGCPYPGGWLDPVKYLCECHNRNIHVERPEQGGEWLSENVRGAGNPQWSQDSTIGLSDIGVSKNESSRLQKIAAIPENVQYGGDRKTESRSQDVTLNKIGVSKNESSNNNRITNKRGKKMKRIRWIEQDSMVSSFPMSLVVDHYKAFLKAKGEDSRPVDNLSDQELIEYAKTNMNRKDVATLNFRDGSVNHHSWPESFKGKVFTDIETAWKESPFVIYEDSRYR